MPLCPWCQSVGMNRKWGDSTWAVALRNLYHWKTALCSCNTPFRRLSGQVRWNNVSPAEWRSKKWRAGFGFFSILHPVKEDNRSKVNNPLQFKYFIPFHPHRPVFFPSPFIFPSLCFPRLEHSTEQTGITCRIIKYSTAAAARNKNKRHRVHLNLPFLFYCRSLLRFNALTRAFHSALDTSRWGAQRCRGLGIQWVQDDYWCFASNSSWASAKQHHLRFIERFVDTCWIFVRSWHMAIFKVGWDSQKQCCKQVNSKI